MLSAIVFYLVLFFGEWTTFRRRVRKVFEKIAWLSGVVCAVSMWTGVVVFVVNDADFEGFFGSEGRESSPVENVKTPEEVREDLG